MYPGKRAYLCACTVCATRRRRCIECLKLQVSFRERATNYRAVLWKTTCKDTAFYGSSPPCTFEHIYTCDLEREHICAYMCMHVHVCACMCMYVHVCACMCMYVHVCACICMYVHVCACMCMYMRMCMYLEFYCGRGVLMDARCILLERWNGVWGGYD